MPRKSSVWVRRTDQPSSMGVCLWLNKFVMTARRGIEYLPIQSGTARRGLRDPIRLSRPNFDGGTSSAPRRAIHACRNRVGNGRSPMLSISEGLPWGGALVLMTEPIWWWQASNTLVYHEISSLVTSLGARGSIGPEDKRRVDRGGVVSSSHERCFGCRRDSGSIIASRPGCGLGRRTAGTPLGIYANMPSV